MWLARHTRKAAFLYTRYPNQAALLPFKLLDETDSVTGRSWRLKSLGIGLNLVPSYVITCHVVQSSSRRYVLSFL
jgi:hypothetical protein